MKRAKTVAFLAILIMCSNWTAFATPTRSVHWAVNNRASLTGQKIAVEGFLLRMGTYYFLAEGKRRPDTKRGDHREEYWCNFTGAPKMLWFSSVSIKTGDLQKTIPDNGPGRHVIISGIFYNETSGVGRDESPLLLLSGKEFSEEEVGPLRRVRIVKLLRERCDGTPGPAEGTTR